ncbi:MAG: T9SS type A sorting domain-containing protein, partial [Muribaculaceae bacterium]|nr:T9SS type A sorting domain-containing protein [Muribaculaceae bacterium]
YAAGSVSGYDYAGGLVGANYGTVKNSLALNSQITSYHDFAARFGGNNNAENNIEQTYSWEDMVAGHNRWTSHGDHALTKPSTVFRDQSQFKSLTGWDFTNVWEWRAEGSKEYPALRNISNQQPLFSDAYFSNTTSVRDIYGLEAAGTLRVGPNPTSGELHIISTAGISRYALYSVNGALVMQGDAKGVNETTLDLGGLSDGLYILRTVSSECIESINKVIKK